jgi:hypothetical protein
MRRTVLQTALNNSMYPTEKSAPDVIGDLTLAALKCAAGDAEHLVSKGLAA